MPHDPVQFRWNPGHVLRVLYVVNVSDSRS